MNETKLILLRKNKLSLNHGTHATHCAVCQSPQTELVSGGTNLRILLSELSDLRIVGGFFIESWLPETGFNGKVIKLKDFSRL